MIRASRYDDTDKLFEMIKTLPIKPQREKKEDGSYTSRTMIPLQKIYNIKGDDKSGLEEIQKRLTENKLEIAWDGAFGLTNTDFLFTYLLSIDVKEQKNDTK